MMPEVVFCRPDRFLLLSPDGEVRVVRIRDLSPLRVEVENLLRAEALASWQRIPIRITVLHEDPDADVEAGRLPLREELWLLDPEAEWDRRFVRISLDLLAFQDSLETDWVKIRGARLQDWTGFLQVEADTPCRLRLFKPDSDRLWRLSRVHIRVTIPSQAEQHPRTTLAVIYALVSDAYPNVRLLYALHRSALVQHIAEIDAVAQVEAGDGVVTFLEEAPRLLERLGVETGEIPPPSARYIHLATERVRTVPLRSVHPDAFPLHIAPLRDGKVGVLFARPDGESFALFWQEWAIGEDPQPIGARPLSRRMAAADLLRARIRVSPNGVMAVILTDPKWQEVSIEMLDPDPAAA